MPDNEFEEDVRRKMEELSFAPSGEVWNVVETEINKDRKRRRFLIWLPLTGMLLLGAGFAFWAVKNNRGSVSTATETAAVPPAATAPVTGSAVAPAGAGIPPASAAAAPAAKNARSSASPAGVTASTAGPAAGSVRLITRKLPKETADGNPSDALHRSRLVSSNNQIRRNSSSAEINKMREGTSDAEEKSMPAPGSLPATSEHPHMAGSPGANTATMSAGADAVIKKSSPPAGPAPSVITRASSTTATKKRQDTKKGILWGISARGGFSDLLQQTRSTAVSGSAIALAYNLPVTSLKKASMRPGPSASVSIVAEKKFSSTWSLQVGLQYAYATSKVDAAYQLSAAPQQSNYPLYVNTSVNGAAQGVTYYYNAPNSGKYRYTNQYHFIELPVQVVKRLGANSPFSVQAGLSVGRLIGSQAIIFDPQQGTYYKDKMQFRQWQWQSMAGINYSIGLSHAFQLRVGPELQYQLSNLVKAGVPLKDHFLTAGIRVSLLHLSK